MNEHLLISTSKPDGETIFRLRSICWIETKNQTRSSLDFTIYAVFPAAHCVVCSTDTHKERDKQQHEQYENIAKKAITLHQTHRTVEHTNAQTQTMICKTIFFSLLLFCYTIDVDDLHIQTTQIEYYSLAHLMFCPINANPFCTYSHFSLRLRCLHVFITLENIRHLFVFCFQINFFINLRLLTVAVIQPINVKLFYTFLLLF